MANRCWLYMTPWVMISCCSLLHQKLNHYLVSLWYQGGQRKLINPPTKCHTSCGRSTKNKQANGSRNNGSHDRCLCLLKYTPNTCACISQHLPAQLTPFNRLSLSFAYRTDVVWCRIPLSWIEDWTGLQAVELIWWQVVVSGVESLRNLTQWVTPSILRCCALQQV